MTTPDRILVARGRCAGCNDPVAERALDEEPMDVTCANCGATTTLPVTAVTPRAPAASAPAPRAAPRAATPSEARVVAAVVVGVLVLAGAGYGAAAYFGLVSGPAAVTGDDGAEDGWRVLQVSVHHEVVGGEVVLRTSIEAKDGDGNVIPPADVQDPPLWAFAQSSALVGDPLDVDAWHVCDPRECEFRAPAEAWVYLGEAPGPGPGTFAVHAANASKRMFSPMSGWSEPSPIDGPITTTFGFAEVVDADASHTVSLYIASDDADRSVALRLAAGDEDVVDTTHTPMWADGSNEWVTTQTVFSPDVTLTVAEPGATTPPLEVALDVEACGDGETLEVVVEALEGEPLRVREPTCV